jgi:hypothetical protein
MKILTAECLEKFKVQDVQLSDSDLDQITPHDHNIIKQLRIMNFHLAEITGEKIRKDDIYG